MDDIDARTLNAAADEAREHFQRAEQHMRSAGRDHDELMRVHREGWQATSRALHDGLTAIANAIRERR